MPLKWKLFLKVKWIRAFYRLSYSEKQLLIEAVYYMFIAKINIQIFPFKRIVKNLSQNPDFEDSSDIVILQQIRRAIKRANKLAFWRNVCLVQSITARIMLNRRGISSQIYLGLRFEDGKKLAAHAWLKSGSLFITPKGTMQFKEIMRF